MPASDAGSAKGGKVRFLQLFWLSAGPRFRCTIMRLPTSNCTENNPCKVKRSVIIHRYYIIAEHGVMAQATPGRRSTLQHAPHLRVLGV